MTESQIDKDQARIWFTRIPRAMKMVQTLLTLMMGLGLFVFAVPDVVEGRAVPYAVMFYLHAFPPECIFTAGACTLAELSKPMIIPFAMGMVFLLCSLLLMIRNFRNRITLPLGLGLALSLGVMFVLMFFEGTLWLLPIWPKLFYAIAAVMLVIVSLRKYALLKLEEEEAELMKDKQTLED